MTLAVAGVTRWADAIWRSTRHVVGAGTAAAWTDRLRAPLPGLSLRADWQAVLASILGVEDAEPAEPAARSRHAHARVVSPDGAPLPRPAQPAGPRPARPGRSASGPRRGEQARRHPSGDAAVALPVVADAEAVAAVLRKHLPAGVPSTPFVNVPGETPARERTAGTEVLLPPSTAPWRERLARRAAHRLTELHAAARRPSSLGRSHDLRKPGFPPSRPDTTPVEDNAGHGGAPDEPVAAVAGALARTFDTAVVGPRMSTDALRSAAREACSHEDGASRRTSGAVGSLADEGTPPERSGPLESRRSPRSTRRPGAAGSATAGVQPDDAEVRPLHPYGFASPTSAPAPDVPIGVLPHLARSVTQLAPPTGAPSLPPLVPAAVTQPPAFGISAPSLRQATRPEDAAVEDDDLSALAGRIRRILRDEARRHGLTL